LKNSNWRAATLLTLLGAINVVGSARADQAATHYHRAMALKAKGKTDLAIKALSEALVERENYAAAHRSLGVLYRQKKNYTKATIHLERAVALEPNSAETHFSLGLCYFRVNRRDDAIKALRRAVQLKPNEPQHQAALGSALIRTDPKLAAEHLERAVKLKPQDSDHLHQLGLAYRKVSSRLTKPDQRKDREAYLKRAEEHFTRALALKEDAALHFDLGALYRRTERLFKAISHYEKAVQLDPRLAPAYWDLGIMYKRTKQYDQAIDAYQKYLELTGPTGKVAEIAKKRISELKLEKKQKK
jgi:superkiller protein 3